MADELNVTQGVPDKQGFFSTPSGKIVGIVIGLGVLGIIVGVAIAVIMYQLAPKASNPLQPALQTQSESTSTATPSTKPNASTSKTTVAASGPAAQVAHSDVFTFRDIFVPLIKPASTGATGATGTTGTTTATQTTTDTTTPTSAGTLYLDGVVTDNGVLKAQLRFNGQSYTLGPGEGIPGSPWAVLRVSATSVTMLYGDTQVTLAVGQGISK